MADFVMPIFPSRRTPPMSNAERQRRFRERNPGYYNRYYKRLTPAETERLIRETIEAGETILARRSAEQTSAAAQDAQP